MSLLSHWTAEWYAKTLALVGRAVFLSDVFIEVHKKDFIMAAPKGLIPPEDMQCIVAEVLEQPHLIYSYVAASWGMFAPRATCYCCEIAPSETSYCRMGRDSNPAWTVCKSPLCKLVLLYNWQTVFIECNGRYELQATAEELKFELTIQRSSGAIERVPSVMDPRAHEMLDRPHVYVKKIGIASSDAVPASDSKELRVVVFTLDNMQKAVPIKTLTEWNADDEVQCKLSNLKVVVPMCLKDHETTILQPFQIEWKKVTKEDLDKHLESDSKTAHDDD